MSAILEAPTRILSSEAAPAPLTLDGAPSVTTNRLAELAGVSVGSLYQYFPGKQAIFAAVARDRVRATYDALLADIAAAAAKSLPLEEAVSRLVDRFVDLKLASLRLDAGVIKQVVRHGLTEQAMALDDAHIARFAEAIAGFKPRVRADLDPEVAAYVLFHSIRSVLILGSLQRPALAADPALRAELKHLVLAYLGK